MKEWIGKVRKFIVEDVWHIPRDQVSRGKGFLLQAVRILLITFLEFDRNKCSLRASALTYYTLLSIVPIAALLFGVAKGFGLEKDLKNALRQGLVNRQYAEWKEKNPEAVAEDYLQRDQDSQPERTKNRDGIANGDTDASETAAASVDSEPASADEGSTSTILQMDFETDSPLKMEEVRIFVVEKTFDFADRLLINTRGGVLAGIGVIILLWTVLRVFRNIEVSFNEIWGIQAHRSFKQQISNYSLLLVITPLLLIVVSQLTYLFTSQVQDFAGRLGAFESFTVSVVVKLVSFAIIWAMFSLIYNFLPNTRVSFVSAMSAGVVGGTIFIISWWALFNLQIGISRYNAIYGSFLAFPMLLFWLQISWMTLLFGAEYSFAHQNVETYEYEPQSLQVSHSLRKLMMLRIMNDIVKKFSRGEAPWKSDDLAHHLKLPVRLAHQILHELVGCGLLCRVSADNGEDPAYQPSRDPAKLTIKEIVDIWEHHGKDEIEYKKDEDLAKISNMLQDFSEAVERSPKNISIKDL